MFCRNCGSELGENAKFCSKCGTATSLNSSSQSEKSEKKEHVVKDNTIRYQIKPEYHWGYKFFSHIWKFILFMFLLICSIPAIAILIFASPYTVGVTLAIGAIVVVVSMLFEKAQYNDLEYNFYANKLEYKDGFINKEEKELKYKHIREIQMSQGIIERMCGIGRIKIYTNASSGYGSRNSHGGMAGSNGIQIHCIKNINETYAEVKRILEEGTPED